MGSFKDYFMSKSGDSEIVLYDLSEFETENPSWNELLSSNSYLIELVKIHNLN